jgi:TRAP-type mannitol/chloroaromatic compound transport system permease small subunit
LKRNGHVRVDILYQRLGRRAQATIDLLGSLLLLLPVSLFIAWISWEYVAESWAVHEGSREAGGIPGVYLLKTLILLMPALLLVQGIAAILQYGLILAGAKPVTGDSAEAGAND